MYIMKYKWTHLKTNKSGYREIRVLSKEDGNSKVKGWNSDTRWKYEVISFTKELIGAKYYD